MRNLDGGANRPGPQPGHFSRALHRAAGPARALVVTAVLAALAAACGGGGGGAAPVPKPVSVLGVSSPLASRSADSTTLLAFRAALVASVSYPVVLSFTTGSASAGTSCGAGIDYFIAPAPGLSVNAANPANGELTLSSAASSRQINVTVCPGSSAKTIKLNWSDGAASGIASGSVRATDAGLAGSARLNDTGVKACASTSTAGQSCPQAGLAGQDAETGRDADASVTGQGANYTSAFTLTSLQGLDCIHDNVTGLVWEGKSASGLHQADATFTWFNSGTANGGAAGSAAGGVCSGVAAGCDTEKFVAAVNAEALCGYRDWRVPSAQELAGIVDSGALSGPTIDARFLNQGATKYWSASPKAGDPAGAWVVDFSSAAVGAVAKTEQNRLRLVRGH